MPLYRYTAKDLHSQAVKGRLEAEDRDQLAAQLRSQGLFLTGASRLSQKEEQVYRPKANELSEFCAELQTMLSSGITLVRAMSLILQNNVKPKLAALYQKVYTGLQRGRSFSEALADQDGAFPFLLVNMFRSGEASGTMDQAAKKAAEHYQKEHRIRSKIRNAMIYPIVLVVVALLVMLAVFIGILPTFFSSFEGLGVELPLITRAMLGFSRLLTQHWLACLMVVIGALLILTIIFQLPSVQLWKDRVKLRLPKIGVLLRTIYTARFARTLSTLYTSGLSMIQSLSVAAETIGNRYLSGQFDEVIAQVRGGVPLSQALKTVDGFLPKLASVTAIGEESGRLDEMLDNMADTFDFESEKAMDRLVAMLEPAMIIILGVGVGIIMVSVMLPLYTMYQNIG